MNKYIKKLIELGAIVGGRRKEVQGFTIFERVPSSKLEAVQEEELAFATKAMGRAIFTIDKTGKIINYKGVDSHLTNEESASMSLVQGEAVYSSKDGENYQVANYPVNLVVFLGARPDIRIRGASPLEDLEIEAEINSKMQNKGIMLPKFVEVKEFSQEFCEKYGLPMWTNGSFEDFQSDYQEENDIRKQNLKEIYGDNYTETIIEGKRPETLGEYFRRIDIGNDSNITKFLNEKGIPFEKFISYVDSSYSLGQRYGQAIREIETPFRIADIEYYKDQKNIEVLENIAGFMEEMYPERIPFENYFAHQMGINLANMLNNGWCCENFSHRQDYTLSGEMCDDSYFDIKDKLEHAEKFRKTNLGRMKVDKSNTRLKFFLQTYVLSSNIKVLQEEMGLRGKSEKEIESVLNDFLDSFAQTIDLEQVSLNLCSDSNKAREAFELIIKTPKDIEKLLAFKPAAPEDKQYDDEVLAAHKGSNAFFDLVSQGLSERLNIQRSFLNQSKQDIKGISPYEFLEDR